MGTRAKDFTKRKVTVPYKDEPVDCEIMVNDGARAAIKANDAERFVSLIDPKNPKLEKLLRVMEAGWDKVGVRAKNAGHHTLWPEAFEAGACLLREAFPEECDPEFGGEVLSGVAFVGDDKKDRAIDFMQRRPKTDFTMSKYNPLGRLHRDPDAIDYKSPGWMETSMPDSTGEGDDNGYTYRYYNLWLARCVLDNGHPISQSSCHHDILCSRYSYDVHKDMSTLQPSFNRSFDVTVLDHNIRTH